MNDLETLKTRLTQMDWKQVTELSIKAGVPFHTLAKIKRGITRSPTFSTISKLMDILRG